MSRGTENISGAEKEFPLNGDVLESVLSHVPLVHLVPACFVSKSWRSSVTSSLRHFNQTKPWLIVHTQPTRSCPSPLISYAYDPRSDVWLEIDRSPSVDHLSAVRSSHSGNLIYKITPSKFSFSFDPLNLEWHDVAPPTSWRVDPVIALVGSNVVVAGGVCDFEEDPLSVETYSLISRTWSSAPSMPAVFKFSSSASSLTASTNGVNLLYLTEKCSGMTCVYNTVTSEWHGPYEIRPDPRIYFSVNGFVNGRLILVSLMKLGDDVTKIKLYGVSIAGDLFDCKEIGDVPEAFSKKLEDEDNEIPSISVSLDGGFLYVCNASATEEVVYGEFSSGAFMWGSVKNAVVDENDRVRGRTLYGCRSVEIDDLRHGLLSKNCQFRIVA